MSSDDLVSPIECPPSWTLVSLKSICKKIGSGATPTGGQAAYQKTRTKFALVRSQNVFDREFSEAGLAFISDEQADSLRGVRLEKNDILLNITGDGVTFGRACLVPATALPACVNQHVSIIRLDSQQADPGYVVSYLTHPTIKSYIESFNAGGSRRAITKAHIESFVVPLPPLATQRAIAALLGGIDDRITLLRETNATLEAIAQALFKSWFVDFDPVRAKMEGRTPEGMDEATAALFPDGFETSELGEVPRGWRVMPFLDACDMQGGAQPPASQFVDTPIDGYVRLLQIRDFSSDAHKTYVPIEKKLKLATEDDVLIGRYGSASGDKAKDSLGRVCRGLAGAYNVALMKLAPIEIGREFALQLVDDPRFYQYLQGVSSKAVQSGFSKKELGQYKVVVPPAPLTKLYEQFGEAVWQRSKELRSQAQTLSTLRDALLPRLISGQLRIPNAEMDAMTA